MLQYKDNDMIIPNFDKFTFLEENSIDDFYMQKIVDDYSDMITSILSSLNPTTNIFSDNSFSLKFCEKLFQLFISNNITIDQKYTLIELLDTIIISNTIEKNEHIFNLVLSILSINDKTSRITDLVFKCMLDIICPKTIHIFPKEFYDIIKSTENKIFMCQIASKISEYLTPKDRIGKESFVLFLADISEFVDAHTALFIYRAHLNFFYVFPESFPLLDLDFYIDATVYDLETQITFLNLLSCIKKCYEIFKNPEVQKLILYGLENSDSTPMTIQSIRALSNLLESDTKTFKEIYNDEFCQKLVSKLNFLILESAFNIKSDASYLLCLLLSNLPQMLLFNICGNSTVDQFCDIRESISIIFGLDQIVLTLKLLYGLESIFLFALQENVFDQFNLKISEYEIIDIINELTKHDNQEIASTANIVFSEIIKQIENES